MLLTFLFHAAAAQQNQAALQNQSTGVQAGIGAGNVTAQDISNLLTTGQYQQAAPFINASNYGKILGGISAPQTVTNQTQLSPLNQIAGLYSLLGGTGATSLLGAAGTSLSNLFSGSGGGTGSSGLNPTDGSFSNTVTTPDTTTTTSLSTSQSLPSAVYILGKDKHIQSTRWLCPNCHMKTNCCDGAPCPITIDVLPSAN